MGNCATVTNLRRFPPKLCLYTDEKLVINDQIILIGVWNCFAETTMQWLEIESCEGREASNHRQHLSRNCCTVMLSRKRMELAWCLAETRVCSSLCVCVCLNWEEYLNNYTIQRNNSCNKTKIASIRREFHHFFVCVLRTTYLVAHYGSFSIRFLKSCSLAPFILAYHPECRT